MRIFLATAIALAALCPAARATDNEFKDIVQTLSDEFHAQPTRIPMFGLVNMVTFVARPAGTKHINLAMFENLDLRDRNGRELAADVRRAVGRAWKPFVQVVSHCNGRDETTLVYMRPEGRDFRLLVTSIEESEATVVELKLNPDGLQKWIEEPRRSAGVRYGSRGDE